MDYGVAKGSKTIALECSAGGQVSRMEAQANRKGIAGEMEIKVKSLCQQLKDNNRM